MIIVMSDFTLTLALSTVVQSCCFNFKIYILQLTSTAVTPFDKKYDIHRVRKKSR